MALDLGIFGGSDTFGGSSAPGIGRGFLSGEGSFGGAGRDTGLFPQRDENFELPAPPGGIRPGRRFFKGFTPEPSTPPRREELFGGLARAQFLVFIRMMERLQGGEFSQPPPDFDGPGKEPRNFKIPIPDFSNILPKPSLRTPTHPGPGPVDKFERKPLRRQGIF